MREIYAQTYFMFWIHIHNTWYRHCHYAQYKIQREITQLNSGALLYSHFTTHTCIHAHANKIHSEMYTLFVFTYWFHIHTAKANAHQSYIPSMLAQILYLFFSLWCYFERTKSKISHRPKKKFLINSLLYILIYVCVRVHICWYVDDCGPGQTPALVSNCRTTGKKNPKSKPLNER